MDLREILAHLKTENGLTTQALSDLSGVPKGTLNKLLNGETRDPRNSTLRALAGALNCPVELLASARRGEAPEEPRWVPARLKNGEDILPVYRRRVPLLGSIAAGEPIYAQEEYGECVDCGEMPRCDFALRVQGDSMIGARIRDGDVVFIRAQEDVDDGQIAAVAVDGTATLKHVYHISGGLQLISDNPDYPPMIFNADNSDSIRILGLAVAFQSRL